VDALTRTAITGTSRETPPANGLPTDDLLGSAQRSPERDLLLRAGMHAVYKSAGRRAEAGVEAPVPASEEKFPACSAKAAEILRRLLTGQRPAILREALDRLRLAGLRVPHALLPAALDVRQTELRPTVAAVLGERGPWLAAQNPDWGWAAATGTTEEADETIWEEGAPGERISTLRRVRGRDPALGLAWVEDVWKSEKADARVAIVTALETGLSSGDEEFLQGVLDDRSVRVREAAATLLALIPESDYAGRAAARADAILVRYEPPAGGLRGVAAGLSRRGHAGGLAVEPPEDSDAGWGRDLPGDVPEHGVGEKAWRISRALSVVTPAHWEKRFGVVPADLISAAHGDWEMALLAGWCQASVLHRESSWAVPLWRACYRLEHDLEGWQTWQIALSMANLLPQSELALAIAQLPKNGEMPFRLSSTLQAISGPWQQDLSEAFLEGLRRRISGICRYGPAQGEEPWVTALPHASVSLASGCLKRANGFRESLEGCRGLPDHALRRWGPELERFEETLELRRKLVEEIPL
jgi:hypothetical protein